MKNWLTAERKLSLLSFKQVQSLTGMSRSTIYQEVQRGEFPKPLLLSLRKVAFLQLEL